MSQQAAAVNQIQTDISVGQRAEKASHRKVKPVRLSANKKSTIGVMNKRHKRLLSVIASTLADHGSLDDRKAAVVALAKEAKVGKTQLKEFIELACKKYPEINPVMRITKKIRTLKASGKTPNVAMFKHLLPEAKLAGKSDFWLSEKLGYVPAGLQQQIQAAGEPNAKKSIFGIIKS